MAKKVKRRFLHSGVIGAVTGIGLALSAANAQAILSVDQAIDPAADLLSDVTPFEGDRAQRSYQN